MSYVQGFLVPVPRDKKQIYCDLAAKSAPIFLEYGATRIRENWGDSVPDGKVTDFKRAVKANEDEAVVFSWIEWPDKATCDAAAEKMQKDKRWGEMGEMPFDGMRMIWAGFDPVFDSGAQESKSMSITVSTLVDADINTVWSAWTTPADINQWNAASDDWHTPSSENDLQVGGRFSYRMEAKDGSMGFDFEGTYTKIVENELIEYRMDDGRQVSIGFAYDNGGIRVTETFDAEDEHSAEQQRLGWQSILDNFSRYVETLGENR